MKNIKKITSHILIVATVIAILPLQSFALSGQVKSIKVSETEKNQAEKVKKFGNDTDRVNFIKNKAKTVRKKNLGDSINEKSITKKAQKLKILTEGFHDRKKHKKEVLVASTGSLQSIQEYISNVDTSASVKPLGKNMYSVVFQEGKNLDTSYFQDTDQGIVPEKLFDYPIIQPTLVSSDAIVDPYLAGESINNLWGMTKMEATNFQKGLSLQPNPVAIGILDSGIDKNHKDLAKNLWTNTKEIAGNSIDDDGNGYVDDITGYDFVNNDNDSTDDHGHGTHVSGTAAGVANGGGVFGVNASAKIVPLKVLAANGHGSSYGIYRALLYAADNGIKVVNLSLGAAGPTDDAMCAGITYAKSKGTISVVSAGNSNADASRYVPAACPDAVTVGAVDSTLTKAGFSNYGIKVDVSAPGAGIYSSTRGNGYSSWAGTSMASPHIAGLISAIKTYRPYFTGDDIKVILKNPAFMDTVKSTVPMGYFPNMTKIFKGLGIQSDSELSGSGGDNGSGAINPPDTTAPVSDAYTISFTTQTGTTLSARINEDGTGYYLVLPGSAANPSVSDIIATNNSFAMKAFALASVKIGGLTASTPYKVWFVAKDLAGNIQPVGKYIGFTTNDIPPPAPLQTMRMEVSSTTQTGTTLIVQVNGTGTGYYLAIPTPAEGIGGGINPSMPAVKDIVAANNSFALQLERTSSVQIGGLIANTKYTLWFVAKDTLGTLQREARSVGFRTLAAPVPVPVPVPEPKPVPVPVPVPVPTPIDTLPPQTVSLATSLTTQTGVTLSTSMSENGKGYYLITRMNDTSTITIPSVTTIVAANNMIEMRANTVSSVKIGGLMANTKYTLWFVAKDLAGNLQREARSVGFTTLTAPAPAPIPAPAPRDTTPPQTVTLTNSYITQTTTVISTSINEDGKGYYMVIPYNVPTSATGAVNVTPSIKDIIAANNSIVMKAGVVNTIQIGGLKAGTLYMIWFVAQDTAGNLQLYPRAKEFFTTPSNTTLPPGGVIGRSGDIR